MEDASLEFGELWWLNNRSGQWDKSHVLYMFNFSMLANCASDLYLLAGRFTQPTMPSIPGTRLVHLS